MPKADRSMPSSSRPASREAATSLSTISRRTATTTTACAAGRRLDRPERLPVEDRLVHRHRDVVGRLDLDGGGERLLVLSGGRSSVRTTIRWLAMPSRTRFGSSCSAKKVLQRLGQRGDVGDLTVAQDAGTKRGDGAALDRDRAVDGDLGGGDVAGSRSRPTIGLVGLLVLN